MQDLEKGGFRLIACNRDGMPSEPIRDLPEAMIQAAAGTADLYERLGFVVPWISYVATVDGQAVGGGAFVGPPIDNRVEIAYFTLPERQGEGLAGKTAQELVSIARTHSPTIEIVAKTMPERDASARILERLGFDRIENVIDHEIGEAWAWLLR